MKTHIQFSVIIHLMFHLVLLVCGIETVALHQLTLLFLFLFFLSLLQTGLHLDLQIISLQKSFLFLNFFNQGQLLLFLFLYFLILSKEKWGGISRTKWQRNQTAHTHHHMQTFVPNYRRNYIAGDRYFQIARRPLKLVSKSTGITLFYWLNISKNRWVHLLLHYYLFSNE